MVLRIASRSARTSFGDASITRRIRLVVIYALGSRCRVERTHDTRLYVLVFPPVRSVRSAPLGDHDLSLPKQTVPSGVPRLPRRNAVHPFEGTILARSRHGVNGT